MEVDGGGGGEEGLTRQGSGGAGQDATGGDPREEGAASREGGADGARGSAAHQTQDTSSLVQNFLQSLNSGPASSQQRQQPPADLPYTTLPDLLPPSTVLPFLHSCTRQQTDTLCAFLPPELFLLAQESAGTPSSSDPDPTPAAGEAAIEALSTEQKTEILVRCARSPQFAQSLGSLTVALRDGGLPMIGEALGLVVEHGGTIRGGVMPLGGGQAVRGFVEGVRRTVERGPGGDEEEGDGEVTFKGRGGP
ncbi:hypothetical protein LTR53_004529 [Teratosphaeriaceae sp. CCFEE 6253]|nr:hypothetical protein LTR53_004529 [Teratosphaeriaceae sp. CCFEE 6253]